MACLRHQFMLRAPDGTASRLHRDMTLFDSGTEYHSRVFSSEEERSLDAQDAAGALPARRTNMSHSTMAVRPPDKGKTSDRNRLGRPTTGEDDDGKAA